MHAGPKSFPVLPGRSGRYRQKVIYKQSGSAVSLTLLALLVPIFSEPNHSALVAKSQALLLCISLHLLSITLSTLMPCTSSPHAEGQYCVGSSKYHNFEPYRKSMSLFPHSLLAIAILLPAFRVNIGCLIA